MHYLILLKDDDREPQPGNYILYSILTFENIGPAGYFDFTSFVEYYGEYWGGLGEHTKLRDSFNDEKNIGYLEIPFSYFDGQRWLANKKNKKY